MIHPEQFKRVMLDHWTSRLNNVANKGLIQSWEQLASTFNYHILVHKNQDEKAQQKWSVLQPPTGSGKSQGTVIYCSMLAQTHTDEQHPGVLIVQRLISDCDLMTEEINKYGQRPTAIAYHSDSKTKLTDLKHYSVVVITHRAYELALDYLGRDGTIRDTWSFFHDWNDTGRSLVVIDECIDVVEHSQAGLDGLRNTLGAIPQSIRRKFPVEIETIEAVAVLLDQMDRLKIDNKGREQMIDKQEFLESIISEGKMPDFTTLRSALRTEGKFDIVNLHAKNPEVREKMARVHDIRLKAVHNIFKSWIYYHPYIQKEGRHTLNTARLLIPDNIKGAVVLDATASVNPLYTEKVFAKAELKPAPKGTRNYRNVTLYVSRGHKTGKKYMTSNTKEVCDSLVTELSRDIGSDRKCFVVTHKDVRPTLETYETPFRMDVGHYGKVNGSNQWQDCDTAVIFGLFHLPDTWSPNVFMAHQGERASEWLSNPEFNGKDIRKALKHGQMVVDVVQAINRIRCRRTINAQGDCPRAVVYLLLPNGELGDDILKGIEQEMPGINVKRWNYQSQKRKPKRSLVRKGLLTNLRLMDEGKITPTQIAKELGTHVRSIKRILAQADFHEQLKEIGIKYVTVKVGKVYRAYFVKSTV